MDMILKLLHDALYMGATARHYQIHTKHMTLYKYWPHLIIDQHRYHCHHTVSSYQHEFFDCGITPQLWTCINSILDSAQLPARLQSIADLPEFLFDAHNPEFNLRCIVNTNIIIATLKAIWDAYQSKKDMNRQQYRALGYGCSARQAGAIDGKTWPDDTVRHLFPGKGGG